MYDKCIRLNTEIDLYLKPAGKKVEYIFKRNENIVNNYKGEIPSSLTNRMTIGKEIIKYLDSKSELKKEVYIPILKN